MKAQPSPLLGLGAVVVTVAALLLGLGHGPHTYPADDPGPRAPRQQEIPSEAEIARPEPEMLRRIDAKLALTREVIGGRLPLRVAARRFRELDGGMPDSYLDRFRRSVPGRNDTERYCRQALDFVAGELCRMAADEQPQPDHEAILGCLHADLERLRADGSLEFDE
jgi:hypothetical protein